MRKETEREPSQDWIVGRNAVLEALRSGRELDKIFLTEGNLTGSLAKIAAMAREQGVVIKRVSSVKLVHMSQTESHQGVLATAPCVAYASLDDLLKRAEDAGEAPFLILCDELEDPHNLGAVIRTAEAAGAHGVIIPKRRSASLTSIVQKTSAGAVNYLPVARVSNLAATIDTLKERGLWVYAADMEGQDWCSVDYSGGVLLVIGSEGSGLGRLVREKCDFFVRLPMNGKVSSLNASVAAGIVMYEIARQRKGFPAK